MAVETELYEVLELSAGCSQADVKKAYHRLALKHHPDRNPGEKGGDSHTKFQSLQLAYEVLSDPQSRSAYDQFGMSSVPGQGQQSSSSNHHHRSSSSNPFGFGPEFDVFDEDDLEDLFSRFGGGFGFGFGAGFGDGGFGDGPGFGSAFGGGGGGRGRRSRRGPGWEAELPPKEETVEIEVGLEDLFNGKKVNLKAEKRIVCGWCKGTGATRKRSQPRQCPRCRGQGTKDFDTCFSCQGLGVNKDDLCKKCEGPGLIQSKKRLEVQIERGMRDGEIITMEGEGDQSAEFPPANLKLRLRLLPHPLFTLLPSRPPSRPPSLLTILTITLSESLLGFSRTILTHLDGRELRLNQPGPGKKGYRVLRNGEVLKIPGEGMVGRDKEADDDDDDDHSDGGGGWGWGKRRKSKDRDREREKEKSRQKNRGDLFVKIEVEMPSEEWMMSLERGQLMSLTNILPGRSDLSNLNYYSSNLNGTTEANGGGGNEREGKQSGGGVRTKVVRMVECEEGEGIVPSL